MDEKTDNQKEGWIMVDWWMTRQSEMNEKMDGLTYRWLNRWQDIRIDGWTDGWTKGQTHK